jgi:protein tyrosine phosphatase (PTP) superfamily phosphohydrolase (DUF442 family)
MDYSQITDQLYIGRTPSQADYDRLQDLGVKLILNMRFLRGGPPRGTDHGMTYVRLPTFDTPLLPIPVESLVRGTRLALEVMRSGGKIYAHCSRGRHRSVAMAAAILIAQGMPPSEAMQLIKRKRAAADPGARHIRPRILQFARQWSEQEAARGARTP